MGPGVNGGTVGGGGLVGAGSSAFAADPARCPFCFPPAFVPRQLLLTTEHFYLLAPAGQVVDGFLSILTHRCRDSPRRLRCLDDIGIAWAGELRALCELVARCYLDVYAAPVLFYEHGRGGGRRSSFPGGDFVFHPHLCALPGDFELHQDLEARFEHREAAPFPRLRVAIGRRPYVYVHTPDRPGRSRPTVYFGGDLDSGRAARRAERQASAGRGQLARARRRMAPLPR